MDLYGEFKKFTKTWEFTGHGLFWSWLNDYSEDKHRLYMVAKNIPLVSQAMQYSLDYRSDLEYMARHHISWDQVHNPSKLSSSNSGSSFVGSSLNYVSDNIKRLYR